jgi:phage-related protein
VGFVVGKVALGQVFPRVVRFSRQFHSTGAPLLGKGQKIIMIIFIFIIGLHNKPHGCNASVASAVGPFTTKKKKGF